MTIGLALLLAACGGAQAERVALSGQTETRAVPVGAFDKLELKGPDRVIVRVGGAPGVTMTGDRAVLGQMYVRVDGDKLVVQRRGRGWSVNGERERATITVSVPRLAAAAVGGSGEMTVDRVAGDFAAAVGGSGDMRVDQVRGNTVAAHVGGSGDLHFGQVEADNVDMAVGGSGGITMAGRARMVEASVAGSGDISAAGLQARTAEVSMAGSGDAAVHATETATVSMAGSGVVIVTGGARCQTSKMGSGQVRCG